MYVTRRPESRINNKEIKVTVESDTSGESLRIIFAICIKKFLFVSFLLSLAFFSYKSHFRRPDTYARLIPLSHCVTCCDSFLPLEMRCKEPINHKLFIQISLFSLQIEKKQWKIEM